MTILERDERMSMMRKKNIIFGHLLVPVIRNPIWVWYQIDRVFPSYAIVYDLYPTWIEKKKTRAVKGEDEGLADTGSNLEKEKKKNNATCHMPL